MVYCDKSDKMVVHSNFIQVIFQSLIEKNIHREIFAGLEVNNNPKVLSQEKTANVYFFLIKLFQLLEAKMNFDDCSISSREILNNVINPC